MNHILKLLLLSLAFSAIPSLESWGIQGHYMTCKLAEQYLTTRASAAVKNLLPEYAAGELASVCSWADEVKFRYRWSSPLHYVNTPGVCNFQYSRDCHNSRNEQDMCVVGAINNYTNQLLSYGDSSTEYNLTQSLMFLAHFLGDVHQPLHCGFADDLGGNTIVVHWYGEKTNLHHVWDDNMIETAMKDFYSNDVGLMLEAIIRNITEDEVGVWESCDSSGTCAEKYASESISLACDYAYKDVEQGYTLGDEYFYSRLPVLKQRIAQGGVRLGGLLNKIFEKNSVEDHRKPKPRNTSNMNRYI